MKHKGTILEVETSNIENASMMGCTIAIERTNSCISVGKLKGGYISSSSKRGLQKQPTSSDLGFFLYPVMLIVAKPQWAGVKVMFL